MDAKTTEKLTKLSSCLKEAQCIIDQLLKISTHSSAKVHLTPKKDVLHFTTASNSRTMFPTTENQILNNHRMAHTSETPVAKRPFVINSPTEQSANPIRQKPLSNPMMKDLPTKQPSFNNNPMNQLQNITQKIYQNPNEIKNNFGNILQSPLPRMDAPTFSKPVITVDESNELKRQSVSISESNPMCKKVRSNVRLFHFVLTRFSDYEFSNVVCPSLSEYCIAMRGDVVLQKNMSESEIREQLIVVIREKFPLVGPNDLEFLKANRKSIQIPHPLEDSHFGYQELRNLVGQGKLYLKLRNGTQHLLENDLKFKTESNAFDNSNLINRYQSTVTTCVQVDSSAADSEFRYEDLFDELTDDNVAAMCNIERGLEACENAEKTNAVELLRCYKQSACKRRNWTESKNEDECLKIYANRWRVLESAFEELDHALNSKLFYPLSVSYFGEKTKDTAGGRQEFLYFCIKQIKEKYFDHGFINNLAKDYEKIAIIMSISILQSGPFPSFIPEDLLDEIFNPPAMQNQSIAMYMQKGFVKLGFLQLGVKYPQIVNLFKDYSNPPQRQSIIDLMMPNFTDNGTMKHKFQCAVYEKFLKYIREVSNSQRKSVTLSSIFVCVTGMEELPILGLPEPPCIQFAEVTRDGAWHFTPKVDISSQCLTLITGTSKTTLPSDQELFNIFDSTFLMQINANY